MSAFAEVMVPVPVPGPFHYAVPPDLQDKLRIGHRVLVPFGPRRMTGFVRALAHSAPVGAPPKLRSIERIFEAAPLLTADLLEIAAFAADYYLAPVGEVLKVALPPGLAGVSIARLVATAAGRRALADRAVRFKDGQKISDAQRRVLQNAAKPGGIRGQKTNAAAVKRLVGVGWVERRLSVGARPTENEIEVVHRAVDSETAWPTLRKSRLRQEVWARLETGPRPKAELETVFGASRARRTLTRLVADGLLRVERKVEEETGDDALRPLPATKPVLPDLTEAQRAALEPLCRAVDDRQSAAFLLHGVTGSGKTEVYLRVIDHARRAGLGAIVLVPEIALTPQLAARFEARFGQQVAVLHSGVPDAERRRRWLDVRHGRCPIALGARSALWAPVPNLGVVVVDEEHDPSFKQSADVRYHGRDLALTRARQTGAVALLGSATPSMEAMHLVRNGRLTELRLPERVGGRPMPAVQVVDLAEERRAMKGDIRVLSRALADGLRDTVADGHQAILFLNRRGFNTIVYCEECTDARTCRHCDVSLTHHLSSARLQCHYCGRIERLDAPCPKCGGRSVLPMGAGTERVAAAVAEEVPDARVLRLDRDVTAKTGALDEALTTFREGRADILVGTQMVAKGHDFPKVTLVGIVLADASLAFPDFRAAERTFQLITQVAGRAGRAEDPGRVIVQALQPNHYAIKAALDHDTDRFFAIEDAARQDAGYPPHARIGLIRLESLDDASLLRAGQSVAATARTVAQGESARVLGPAPAPIERVRDRWRQMIMIMAPSPARLVHILRRTQVRLPARPRSVNVIFDVDPVDLL
ncbi:MAG: primosomal protein N' [Myxococcota bacterium]